MELLPSGRISDGCELHPGLIFKDKEKKRRKRGEKEEKERKNGKRNKKKRKIEEREEKERKKQKEKQKEREQGGGKEYSTEGCLGMETGFQYLVWDA